MRNGEFVRALRTVRIDRDVMPRHNIGSEAQWMQQTYVQHFRIRVIDDRLVAWNALAADGRYLDAGKCRYDLLCEGEFKLARRKSHGGSNTRNSLVEKGMCKSRRRRETERDGSEQKKLKQTLHRLKSP